MIATFECKFCGNTGSKKAITTFDPLSSYRETVDLFQCLNCGILSVFPSPDREDCSYAQPSDVISPLLTTGEPARRFVDMVYTFFHPYSLKWRVKNVQRQVGIGRILDVGCRNGDFLDSMRQHLWEVIGVETNITQARFAISTLGLKVYSNLRELLPDFQEYFDVISFWHSFGYFRDPTETLDLSLKLLRPNGILLIALPNPASLDSRLYREHWAALDPPRRLFHFTPIQVRNLIRGKKLSLLHKRTIPFDIYYNCLMSEKIIMERKNAKLMARSVRYCRAVLLGFIVHILSAAGSGSGMLYTMSKMDK